MDVMLWINPILSVAAILVGVAGFWLAGLMLPTLLAWLHPDEFNLLRTQPWARFVLWLCMGGLVTLPITDILLWLANLLQVGLGSPGQFSTVFGMVPARIYLSFSLVLMLVVYGCILGLSRRYLAAPRLPERAGRWLSALIVASLVYRGLHFFFAQVFAFNLPNLNVQHNDGTAGFLFEVVIGLLIWVVIVEGVYRLLPDAMAGDRRS
jgi:hypothetical protein